MKYTLLLKITLFLSFLFFTIKSYSQARSGIGIGYEFVKPFSSDYVWANGLQMQGNIALTNKWALTPNFGYEDLLAKRVNYDSSTDYNNHRIGSIDLFYTGISAKYCFNSLLFVKAGAIVYVGGGGDDIAAAGIGGTAAGGLNLNLDERNSLELSVNTNVIYVDHTGNGTTPYITLKMAYVFNFRALK